MRNFYFSKILSLQDFSLDGSKKLIFYLIWCDNHKNIFPLFIARRPKKWKTTILHMTIFQFEFRHRDILRPYKYKILLWQAPVL